jgi:hypothetical protein
MMINTMGPQLVRPAPEAEDSAAADRPFDYFEVQMSFIEK